MTASSAAPVRHRQILDRVPLRRALVSVSDKTGLVPLVAGLSQASPELVAHASGGTFAALVGPIGDAVRPVEALTAYPEMPGGLVKTLHPRIHGGLLADLDDRDQVAHMAEHGMEVLDLVVANLYPFAATAADPSATLEAVRRQIDIGGPTMIRAAAKNFPRVAVVVDPADYDAVLAEVRELGGALSFATRWRLAGKAFAHVAAYDAAIAAHLATRPVDALQEAYALQ